jgi:DNA-binding MurR/RpiR family transcriptional regulator
MEHGIVKVGTREIEETVRPPGTYEELKDAIAARYASLSGQLQRIASFVVENPDDSALETVSSIAGRVDVQPSSIVRFAKAMGYDGFTDMQQVFRSRLIAGTSSYRDRIRNLRAGGEEGESSVLAGFVEEGIEALHLLRSQVPLTALTEAARILARAETIYVLAQRRAFPVAFYLAYALNRLEKRCHLLDGVGGMVRQQANLATTRDCFIAVSFKPYSPAVIDIVTDRSENGVPIVAITDSPLSPLALEATIAFEVKDAARHGFRTLVAPMCLAQSLVVSLGHLLADNAGGQES